MPTTISSPEQVNWAAIKRNHCIAVTGGIATGKSTVCQYIASHGFLVVDADQLSREAIQTGSPGYKKVIQQFGREILDASESIDRSRLASLVFSNAEQRRQLEAIIHPELDRMTQIKYEAHIHKAESSGRTLWFYEASLIFEKNLQDQFRAVWLTDCPEALQIERLMKRNQLSKNDALARIASQMPQAQKRPLADKIIDTNGPIEDIHHHIDALIQECMLD